MHRILLCDDEGMVREGLKFLINKEFGSDFLVEEAKSGRVAIEKANTFRPDIIFMDIQMPGISGIEAMREIKKEHKNIIFLGQHHQTSTTGDIGMRTLVGISVLTIARKYLLLHHMKHLVLHQAVFILLKGRSIRCFTHFTYPRGENNLS